MPRFILLVRIIPAYAGSTLAEVPNLAQNLGSSPHTRGARPLPVGVLGWARIIPAYAGSTRGHRPRLRPQRDHPRIRGEHVKLCHALSCWYGSSPHTRGARLRLVEIELAAGIIPAYAGSTPGSLANSAGSSDHPRIRGEHSTGSGRRWTGRGSSPHTRGAHLEIPAIPRIAVVIIPVFLYPSPTPQEEADRSMVLLTLS